MNLVICYKKMSGVLAGLGQPTCEFKKISLLLGTYYRF